jgi:hypothetical protein
MIGNTKYIVVGNQMSGDGQWGSVINITIFPFHPTISHEAMFKIIKRARFSVLVSAGFIDEFMQCYGSSSSLRIGSRPEEDTKLLQKMFQIQDKKLTYKSEVIK